MAWTKDQWPHAITTGDIRYGRGNELPHRIDEWYYLCDDSHGIPVFGSVRATDRPDNLGGTEVKVFNYPGQTERIAAELVKRWNAYPKLLAEIDELKARLSGPVA